MLSNIEHLGFFLLRLPSLPLQEIQRINADNTASLAENLHDLLSRNPEVLEAISFASKDLYHTYLSWLENGYMPDLKLLVTLYKYVSRMASRATPFGSFAGVCMGHINDNTSTLTLTGHATIYARVSLDHLMRQLHQLQQSQDWLNDIVFYTNNSIYAVGGYFRYIRFETVKDKRTFFQVKLKINPLLKLLYDYAREGRTFSELITFLMDFDIERNEITAYLSKLLDNQFLISELEPTILEDQDIHKLTHKLKGTDAAVVEMRDLLTLSSCSNRIATLDEFPFNVVLPQVDKKFIAKEVNLKQSVIQLIARELCELHPLFTSSIPQELQVFIQKFKRRYEMMEVPLLEVLDGDLGIGYGDLDNQYKREHPLINNLDISEGKKQLTSTLEEQVMTNALFSGSRHIDLETIYPLLEKRQENSAVAPTCYAIGNLLTKKVEDLDNGNFQFHLAACSGSSAVNLMSRFAYMDEALKNNLRSCAIYEEQCFDNVILADIKHIPENKVGNILRRPKLYSYEIPVLGLTCTKNEKQIPLSDLTVTVRNNQVILFSKKLDKRVIPRLSCAHNFRQGISVYRFLCDLQYQDTPFSIYWNWDKYKRAPFLPRISYKHLILSRARWYIKQRRQFDINWFRQLQKDLRLPNEILIAEGDNELYIDIRTSWGMQLLKDKLALGDVILYESLVHHSTIIKDTNGNAFVNEIIIPFKSIVKKCAFIEMTPLKNKEVKRSFLPGSEWIYIKLYCPQKTADEILAEDIMNLVRQLKEWQLIDKCFFTRYHDPEFHIRLRLHAPNNSKKAYNKLREILRFTMEHLASQNKIWTVQYDTYVRELERYGVDNIEHCESIFSIDSAVVLDFLATLPKDDVNVRWLFGLKAVDQLFNAFGINLSERFELTEEWSLALAREFKIDKVKQKKMNLNYRNHAASIDALLWHQEPSRIFAKDLLEKRFQGITHILQKWKPNKIEVNKLIGSICHMFFNRLFFSDQRANEMVLYSFLAKNYRSRIARSKNESATTFAITTGELCPS